MPIRTGRGRAALVAVAALAAFVPASPTFAAAVDGVDLSPVPAVVDGEPVTSFRTPLPEDGTRSVPFSVRNTGDAERTVRVYAVGVTRRDNGSFSLTDQPSPWVDLPERTLELPPGETRLESFDVGTGDRELPSSEQYAAVVLEVGNGSVVQRVATVVYLSPDPAVPLPVLLVIAAAVLAVVAGAAVVVARRRTAD